MIAQKGWTPAWVVMQTASDPYSDSPSHALPDLEGKGREQRQPGGSRNSSDPYKGSQGITCVRHI